MVIKKQAANIARNIDFIRNGFHYFQFMKHELKKRLINKPPMINLRFEVTNQCNLKCIMCGQLQMKREKGIMSREVFKKVITQVPDYSLNQLSFFSIGESLLCPDIYYFIESSVTKSNTIMLSTNGMLLDKEEKIKKLLECGLNHLRFSIDGYSQESYEAVRKNGKFNVLMKNIAKVRKLRDKLNPSLKLDMLYTLVNISSRTELSRVIDFYSPYFDEILFHPVNNQGRDDINLEDHTNFLNYEYFVENKSFPCGLLWLEPTILWDGRVTICCLDYDSELVVGNIMEKPLKEIWEGKSYVDYRNRHRDLDFPEKCKNCFQLKTNAYRFYKFNEIIKSGQRRNDVF